MKNRLIHLSLILAIGALILSGCSTAKPTCTAIEDNPILNYQRGMKALEDGNVTSAEDTLKRALLCDEKLSIVHSGLAIVAAEKAKAQLDGRHRVVEINQAIESLNRAQQHADRPDQLFDYYTAVIRTDTLIKQDNWLADAESVYSDGRKLNVDERNLSYYQGTEALHYFMGQAWLEGMEFQKARDAFNRVLYAKREGKWHEKADRSWKRVDRIVRAMGALTVGDVGKKIATKEKISRIELAALLLNELKMEKIMAGRIPTSAQLSVMPEFIPADIAHNPFKEDVLSMMKWNIRGMEPKYDATSRAYLFRPDDPVTRGELAFILEDVLIKLTGDEKIATAFIGHDKSPFPDVKPTSAFYNAVMNMTSRSIMESELSGEFRVHAPADGAEALLAIRVLKQKLNTY